MAKQGKPKSSGCPSGLQVKYKVGSVPACCDMGLAMRMQQYNAPVAIAAMTAAKAGYWCLINADQAQQMLAAPLSFVGSVSAGDQ
jgi:hypothetical protein